MSTRVILWRTFYALINLIRKLYWRVVRPHTRGAKCLIENDGKFLLVKLAYAHKKWTLPGGGVHKRESFQEGARRELLEETGITTDLNFFGQYESSREFKRDIVNCFYGKTDILHLVCDPLEIADSGWFAPNMFPPDRSGSVDIIMELFSKWK